MISALGAYPKILANLLGDPKIDRTLNETVSFIAPKEHGKSTRSVVGDSAGAIHNFHNFRHTNSKQPAPVKSTC